MRFIPMLVAFFLPPLPWGFLLSPRNPRLSALPATFIPEEVEIALSSKKINRDRVRLLVSEAVANLTLALSDKNAALSDKQVHIVEQRAELQRVTMELLRLKGLLDMRGASEEIIRILRLEPGMPPAGAWTEKEWEKLLSLPKWQPLGEELIRSTGWKREWLPSKLQTMWHNLSARIHDVQGVQGGETQAVVISLKVASGEECLAFSVLCDRTNIVYIFDSESGYLRTGDL